MGAPAGARRSSHARRARGLSIWRPERHDALMASEPEAIEEVLRSLGVPEEAIERASRHGDPLGAFFEAVPIRGAAGRTVSAAEIEAGGGMPVRQAQELMRAFGFSPPGADDPAFT